MTAKNDAENARRELREERARPGLLARLKNVVSRERPADIALYPTIRRKVVLVFFLLALF